MSNNVTEPTTTKELKLGAEFTTITDRRGTHIKIYIKECDRETQEYVDDVGMVNYHVATHSITIGKRIKEGYTETDLALFFTDLLKDKEFKGFIKDAAEVKNIPNRPVWCKQLNKHFR